MTTRWPNRRAQVSNGTVVVAVLLWLSAWSDETAFAGLAVLVCVWQVVCFVADTVDRRNADYIERNTP